MKLKTIKKIHNNSYWVEDHGFVDKEEMEHISKYIDWKDVEFIDESFEGMRMKQIFQGYLQEELMKVKVERMKAKGTWTADTIITPENLMED